MDASQSPRELALQALESSTYRVQVGAVLSKRGEILAVGHNCEVDGKGVHAEFVAILDVIKNFHGRKNRRRLYGAHLTVAARRKKSGNIISARPCERFKLFAQSISTVPCLTLAKLVGIKKIEYTTKDGSWVTETL